MNRPFFYIREVIVNACLYDNFRVLPLEEAVRQALILYSRSEHTAGQPVGALHLNPGEMPDSQKVNGLPVKPDEDVRPGFIRVVAAEASAALRLTDR